MTELEKLRAENRLLEAHNKYLEMENAVLKKTRGVGKKVMLSGVRQNTTVLTDIAALRMNTMQSTKRSIRLRGSTVWCISSICWQSFAESVQSIGVLSRK